MPKRGQRHSLSDPVLRVVLDDLDPFRNLADRVEPERLTDDETARRQTMLDRAWALCVLHEEDDKAVLYAPWRDDPRPLGGLIQGIQVEIPAA